MNPNFDLFVRILVHNSSIQCFPLRGNQETESRVCMVPGPVGSLPAIIVFFTIPPHSSSLCGGVSHCRNFADINTNNCARNSSPVNDMSGNRQRTTQTMFCSGRFTVRSANFHATAIPHTANVVQRELWHRGDKAGGDRGAHAGGRRALKGLCHQEQPRPRGCVVVPAGGGHGPALSTVRRGPPHPVGNCVGRALAAGFFVRCG